jgi:hypothetical protein
MLEFAVSVLLALAVDAQGRPIPHKGRILIATWPDGTRLWRLYGYKQCFDTAKMLAPKATIHHVQDDQAVLFLFDRERAEGQAIELLALLRIDRGTVSKQPPTPATLELTDIWSPAPIASEVNDKILWFVLAYLGIRPGNIQWGHWIQLGHPVWVHSENTELPTASSISEERGLRPSLDFARRWKTYLSYAEDIAALEQEIDSLDEDEDQDRIEELKDDIRTGLYYRVDSVNDTVEAASEYFRMFHARTFDESNNLFVNYRASAGGYGWFSTDVELFPLDRNPLLAGEIYFAIPEPPHPGWLVDMPDSHLTLHPFIENTSIELIGPRGATTISTARPLHLDIDSEYGLIHALLDASVLAEATEYNPFLRDQMQRPGRLFRPINWQSYLLMKQGPPVLAKASALVKRHGEP